MTQLIWYSPVKNVLYKVPDSVQIICSKALRRRMELKSVTEIGDYDFDSCVGKESIKIPDSISSMVKNYSLGVLN